MITSTAFANSQSNIETLSEDSLSYIKTTKANIPKMTQEDTLRCISEIDDNTLSLPSM